MKSLKTEQIKYKIDFLLKWLQNIFNTAAILALAAIALVVLYQVVARYALPKSPVWTEELSRYLFIYCITLASSAVVLTGRHVRLELFDGRLSSKWKLIYSVVCHVLVAVFCILLVNEAWKYTMIGDRKTSPTLGIKMSWVFASTFIFFILVSFSCILMALRDFMSLLEERRA